MGSRRRAAAHRPRRTPNTDGKLDVSEDMLRTMIVCQRMLDEQKET